MTGSIVPMTVLVTVSATRVVTTSVSVYGIPFGVEGGMVYVSVLVTGTSVT
jgi:hypothetical protein